MHWPRGFPLGVLMAAAIGCGALARTAPATDRPSPDPSIASALQAALDRWAAAPGHRGVSAAVVFENGAAWSAAAGLAADAEPLRPDHLIQIASITKTMTAGIVLQLVDEGVLLLEDPVSRWLPPRAFVDPAITIRQLLNHTNGLANYTGTAELSRAIAADASRVFSPDELLAFVGPPRFAPGADTEYTNTSFLLLGQMVERATSRLMIDLYRQRLWAPLELTGVFLPGFEEPPGPVATAWASGLLARPMDRMSVLSIGHSAFGLLADAATVARWGDALFRGTVISAGRQREMRELVPAAGNIPGETGAGLGIRGYEYLGRTQYGHSGGAAYGSSLLLFDPDAAVTVAVLMNQGAGAGHFQLAPELLEIAAPASGR